MRNINTCTSTNNIARAAIDDGRTIDLIVAQKQTHAYGRNQDTKWYSPAGAGIYMSIIVREPKGYLVTEDWFITERIGHALKWSLRTLTRLNIEQRGVNDLFVDNRKVGGVLCEIHKGYLIIGIGINLFRPKRVPAPYNKTAIWLDELLRADAISVKYYIDSILNEVVRLVV
jgi:BirA family biotin operon repressor/biotin-[acetyl-CoA-carboxylase] ligase